MRRAERLTKNSDFRSVYGHGRSLADRMLVLYLLPHPGSLKLGISVSKKVSRGSVGRNRLKRLVREAFRELRPQIASGYQMVIIVRVAAKEAKYGQILLALSRLIKRGGLLVSAED